MRLPSLVAAVDRALRASGIPLAGETVVVGLSGGADSVALLDALAVAAPAGGASARWPPTSTTRCGRSRRRTPRSAAPSASVSRVPLHTAAADVAARAGARGGRAGAGGPPGALRVPAPCPSRDRGAGRSRWPTPATTRRRPSSSACCAGPGPGGSAACAPGAGRLVRPMLAVSRAEVLAHLRERALPWREDPTNADPRFLRNRVRHELLPYLEARFNPSLRAGLARTAAPPGRRVRPPGEARPTGSSTGSPAPRATIVVLDRLALAEAPAGGGAGGGPPGAAPGRGARPG